ncbi:hypothetical protein [Acetobacterium tundrae]|uniref:Uncharacterized protein n=1 Tax=Acetobacterium tundrae TaxID=132932 RepID=A0ABR6WLA2_9FIRM|nr:hypothetical protein [Acetobacterium tundrae]MBC3797283.1 hypothetical protein [Acetobacterium tundrae]
MSKKSLFKRDEKKNSKSTKEKDKLSLIKEKLAENPEVVEMIQEENDEKTVKTKSKKQKKEKEPKKEKSKLLKIGLPIGLLVLILAGAGFFILKSGMFFSSGMASGSKEDTAEEGNQYTQAQAYYTEGKYYDASALFTLLGDYEDSKEMLGKIKLENSYPGNGSQISEYIGSDVINDYIRVNKNYADINTALSVTNTADAAAQTDTAAKTDTAAQTDAAAQTDSAAKTDAKTEYDEGAKETVKEKTDEIMAAGNRVKCLNLSSSNIMNDVNEVLKKSADYSNQAAWKIQEGVKNGTYQPDGTSQESQEVKTLLDSMNSQNDIFLKQVDETISGKLTDMLSYSEAGACMKKYSESYTLFYSK